MISSSGTGGGVRDEYARVDWAASAVGTPETWSPTLVAAVDLTLSTRFPVTLLWGPEFVLLYNDAYVQLIGDKHPAALGARAEEIFPEIWDQVGPMLNSVHDGGSATWVQDLRLDLKRHGFLEECYFTFSYSAVRGADGEVEGVIDITAESTGQIIAGRRMALLAELTTQLAGLSDLDHVHDRALRVLRTDPADLQEVEILRGGEPPAGPAGTDLFFDGRKVYLRLSASESAENHTLLVTLSPVLPLDPAYLGFLRLIGSSIGQAINRVGAQAAERRIAILEKEMSEALQRSLLTDSVAAEGVQIAVRYRPAAEQAYVGGDWYDSFAFDDGCLTVAMGDVTGHDRQAAAAMAQVRNLLRGIAYTIRKPPALILSELDRCLSGLGLATVATILLAQLEPDPRSGRHTLQWANAGHPPPALLRPDGTACLLEAIPEVLLGAVPTAPRTDHLIELEPGSSVVLFTDGLIERRRPALSHDPESLIAVLAGCQHLSPERLCDRILAHFGEPGEDDVALTVVRTLPIRRA
ncbi:hypothetical protein Rhe02_67410 [Rhizocola hellebori]|uniref:PPM-type phosphatase domain-containing protein n=1 Tax=Rhizocola hellebori TaxID=1392758 RepID=A0A8J3QFB6_9ACTN|nr:PP2C family protein-serine/threonine phosphatase [Rhizocola hellebori]GIH08674.1 hypothetical protein Rhe02_67410 [Rhizocola hellebori]